MKINFTKLNVGNDTSKLDIDFGNGFNPVSISTIKIFQVKYLICLMMTTFIMEMMLFSIQKICLH